MSEFTPKKLLGLKGILTIALFEIYALSLILKVLLL